MITCLDQKCCIITNHVDLHINETVKFNNVCPGYEPKDDNVCTNAACANVKPVCVDSVLDTDVPLYIQHIVKSSCDYFKCSKVIAYRYQYVLSKLGEKGLKNDTKVASGPVTVPELDRSRNDLLRIVQESYYVKRNIDWIAQHGLDYALKHCSENCIINHGRLHELEMLFPFYDQTVKLLRVGGGLTKSSSPVMLHILLFCRNITSLPE